MSQSADQLSMNKLSQLCQQESEKYFVNQPYDETYCLELFRRALLKHDQAAWDAIYAQYKNLVASWVLKHREFQSTEEEVDFFINEAFERFWRSLSKQDIRLKIYCLGQLLRYLKSCVHSSIGDASRRRERQPRNMVAWDDLSETLPDNPSSVQEQSATQLSKVLEQVILSRLRDEEEEVVAILSWVYGLRPREIQVRHSELFPQVKHVYRVKRNVLNRLLRDPEIQKLRRQMR